jgi:hypothetical protein
VLGPDPQQHQPMMCKVLVSTSTERGHQFEICLKPHVSSPSYTYVPQISLPDIPREDKRSGRIAQPLPRDDGVANWELKRRQGGLSPCPLSPGLPSVSLHS